MDARHLSTPLPLKGGVPAEREDGRAALLGKRLLDDELMLPAAVLKASALDHNGAWMRDFLARTGVRLCPHAKTTLAPALMRRQIADGAWGLTAATAHHVRLYRRFGFDRILMANQLVGAANIAWIDRELQDHPDFAFWCLVDSPEGVAALSADRARPIDVLVEIGAPARRTGARTLEDAVRLARAVRAAPGLRLAGVECFEGVFQVEPEGLGSADDLMSLAAAAARAMADEGLFETDEVLISAGGSGYMDIAAARLAAAAQARAGFAPVMRSGCYLTHDHGMYERLFDQAAERDGDMASAGGLRPALEVWAHVQSRPEPGFMVATLGKRDAGTDAGLPVPLLWSRPGGAAPLALSQGHETLGLYDQHACLRVPDQTPLAVGDLLGFGVSHPCTTFDKWRTLLVVDDDYRVIDLIDTAF